MILLFECKNKRIIRSLGTQKHQKWTLCILGTQIIKIKLTMDSKFGIHNTVQRAIASVFIKFILFIP